MASNGAKFGGSPNDSDAASISTSRPIRCASLAAGPMTNQLQDSSVDLLRVISRPRTLLI